MQILRKIIDYESFEDSQENVYDGVYFSKAAVYKMQLYRLYYRFFSAYVSFC